MSTHYTVRVVYVDDSYWDDGNRTTWQDFKFSTQKEAVAFAEQATTKGCEVRGRQKKLHVRPSKDYITVKRHSETIVKWDAPRTSPAKGGSE